MDSKYHSLETRDTNTLIKVFRVIFGIACIAIACFWLIYNFKAVKSDNTLWITVVFLTGFGLYLIWSGFGYGQRFIELQGNMIRFRKNSFLRQSEYNAADIARIDFFPLKVIIHTRKGEKNLIRFGVSEIEKVESIKDDLMKFAADNNIETELVNEM